VRILFCATPGGAHVRPLLPLLGASQAQIESLDAAAAKDAEALAIAEAERIKRSSELLKEWTAKISLAANRAALKDIGNQLTPQLKANMTTADVATLREAYLARSNELPKGD